MTPKKYKHAKSYLDLPPRLAAKFMTLRTYAFWGGSQGIEGTAHQLSHDKESLPQLFSAADQLNCTLLMCAIEQQRPEIALLLLAAGADPDVVSRKNGGTPLFRAAQMGEIESVRALADAGADLDFSHEMADNNVLMTSIASGQEEVALYLIDRGAKCDQQTRNRGGFTAIDFACVWDLSGVFLRLLDKGVLDSSEDKEPPLLIAAKHGAKKVALACLADKTLCLPALDDRYESLVAACAKNEIRELILSFRSEAAVDAAVQGAVDGEPDSTVARAAFPSL